jgi:hypothetical protein
VWVSCGKRRGFGGLPPFNKVCASFLIAFSIAYPYVRLRHPCFVHTETCRKDIVLFTSGDWGAIALHLKVKVAVAHIFRGVGRNFVNYCYLLWLSE